MNGDSAVKKVEVTSGRLIKYFLKWKMWLNSEKTEVILTEKKAGQAGDNSDRADEGQDVEERHVSRCRNR